MKLLVGLLVLIALHGCEGVRLYPEGLDYELAHKCQIDHYHPDCFDPPPVYKSS